MTLESVPALTGISAGALGYALVVVLLAGVVRGYTGFAFSALVVSSVSLVVAPARLVPVLLLLEIIASVHMLPRVWRSVDWARFRGMLVGIAVGTPLGMALLAWLSADVMRVVISTLVLLACGLLAAGGRWPAGRGAGPALVTGFVAGAVNGAAAVGGLIMVVMFMATGTGVAATRATLVALLFATEVVGVGAALANGLMTVQSLWLTALLTPALIAGVAAGRRLFLGATPEHFRRIVLVLLALLSAVGILRAVAGY